MAEYGDFGAGSYTSIAQKIGLPVILTPSLPSVTPIKAPQNITAVPASPSLAVNHDAAANQALAGTEATSTVALDKTDNQAISALTFPNPITGI